MEDALDQFKVELSDEMIATLTERFPDTSGRDIKELLKLTAKFCRSKNIPSRKMPSVNVRCSAASSSLSIRPQK